MEFITRCTECGDQNPLGDEVLGCVASIQVYFHKGSENIKDRMVIYCENCGNKIEQGISWTDEMNGTPIGG